jgi:GntR family transcriptional repressor for pyruvate dehydrogenase complex
MSERIARQIVDYIIAEDLAEGTMLPVESELVDRLQVGRTTLREALLLLETWGVITIKAGRNGGPVVRRLGREGLQEALSLQLHFAGASLQDIIEARAAVEPMSARLAAARMKAEEIEALEASVARMRENLDSKPIFLEENRRFHSIIAESTRSVVLHAFIDTIKTISDGAVVGVEYSKSLREAVADAHERITVAIKAGEEEVAEYEMRHHIEEARAYWEKLGGIIDRPIHWA